MQPSPWNLFSRVHPLNAFPPDSFVKRDDELSCGISGSKLRKYSSLLPALLQRKISRLLVIAGAQSNNLLAIAQVAREYRLGMTALLLKPWVLPEKGNYALSRLFLEEEDIVWVKREDWSSVRRMAESLVADIEEPCFILDEGASVAESLSGAMTLGDDIIHNEHQLGIRFQHIFIDAGTGFSAMALAYRLEQLRHPATVHVVLLADNAQTFYEKGLQWLQRIPENVECFFPETAKAFGAVNSGIKQEMKRVAREEGILLDPVYSAKLFYSARRKIINQRLEGNKLLVHTGGVLSLSGFEY